MTTTRWSLVLTLMFLVTPGVSSAITIPAPWSPTMTWDYDRTSSSYHSGVHDDCVDFNWTGGDDEKSPIERPCSTRNQGKNPSMGMAGSLAGRGRRAYV